MKTQLNLIKKILKQQNGAALLLTIFAVMLLTASVIELVYDTSVNYILSSRQVHQLRLKYETRSAAKIAMLRLYYYDTIKQKYPSMANSPYLPMIWSAPLSWPLVDAQKTLFTKPLNSTITPESGKININTFGMPVSDIIKQQVRNQLLQIFERRRLNDTNFDEAYSQEYIEILISQIEDWVDEDDFSEHSSGESGDYQDPIAYPPEIYEPDSLPPNRFFTSKQELMLIPNMTPELFQMLTPHITLYGSLKLNLFYITPKLLHNFLPRLSSEEINWLHSRITSALHPEHITNIEDLKAYLSEELQVPSELIEILTSSVDISKDNSSFLIKTQATHGDISAQAELLIFNFNKFQLTMLKSMEDIYYEDTPQDGFNESEAPQNSSARPPKIEADSSPPKWPLDIVYFKEF